MQLKLGEKIRELRRRDGRTQEDLANALGVTCQAVSRWEANGGYPDMEIVPAIANYFGVSIDELFGYHGEREKKVDELVEKLTEMNWQNNGRDVCMDECIQLAREGLTEYPGNEKIMLCLASVLYNAGYVRYGEYHLTDDEGYNIFDIERHRTYAEWQEAIKLYEKLLTMLNEGEMRHKAVRELIQLYLNTGEYDKANALANTAPSIGGCREILRCNSCDGRKAAERCGEALLEMIHTCSNLMISGVMLNQNRIPPEIRVQIIRNAIGIYDLACSDGNYGIYHSSLACKYMYLSEHLWLANDFDGAFEALDCALEHARSSEKIHSREEVAYTSPLLQMVKEKPDGHSEAGIAVSLPDDWPWWFDFAHSEVEREIKADPRWDLWVKQCKE